MRLRLVIPAALAAAATYAALVRDDRAAETAPDISPPLPGRPAGSDRPAPQEVAAVAVPPPAAPAPPLSPGVPEPPKPAVSQFEDLAAAPPPPSTSVYDLLAGAPRPTPVNVAPPTPPASVSAPAASDDTTQTPMAHPTDAWQVPLDEGRFALGGWAASSGHTMVSAVTFRKRLPHSITPDRILLHLDASDNVPDGGLMVLSEPGFAPDRDGFTLLLAAADAGPFSAAGSYAVLPAPEPPLA